MLAFLTSILVAIAVVFLVPPTPAPGADSAGRTPHFPMCSSATPEGTGCWISLATPPDCDFHVGHYRSEAYFSVTHLSFSWSGGCRDGAAHGRGALSALWPAFDGDVFGHYTGEFADGVMQGHWVHDFEVGGSEEGFYDDGLRQGHWVNRRSDGTVWEGRYVDGRAHGTWVRLRDGEVSHHEFRYGELVD